VRFQLFDILRDEYQRSHDERTVIITPDQSENEETRIVENEKDVTARTMESIRNISGHFSARSQD
jgi:hypothetical protein